MLCCPKCNKRQTTFILILKQFIGDKTFEQIESIPCLCFGAAVNSYLNVIMLESLHQLRKL